MNIRGAAFFDVAAVAVDAGRGGVDASVGGGTLEPAPLGGGAVVEADAKGALAVGLADGDAGSEVVEGPAVALAVEAFDEAPSDSVDALIAGFDCKQTTVDRKERFQFGLAPALPETK